MTSDDDGVAGQNRRERTIKPRNIPGVAQDVQRREYSMWEAFTPGVSARTIQMLLVLHVPWIVSTAIMTIAIVIYFLVHPWPAAFTETVLATIVSGTAVASGSRAITLWRRDN